MRRSLLVFSLLLAACSSKEDPVSGDVDAGPDGALNAIPEWDKPVTPPADVDAEKKRLDCGFAAGALPAETQGKSRPMAKDIPIDTIVIVMMENRSFDHYFQKAKEHGLTDMDVAPADFSNPDKDGKPVPIFRETRLCFVDTNHGWAGVHEQVGAMDTMDGFVKTNEGNHEIPVHGTPDMVAGSRAMAYYDKPDLPFMYWAAEQFAVGDRYFCSLQGPTWPNRMFLYGASSWGRTGNSLAEPPYETIFDLLEKRGVTWRIYPSQTMGAGVVAGSVLKYAAEHVAFSGDEYYADAAAGKLPQVVFVDPKIGKEGYDQNDEHPPAVMQIGQEWLARVTKALIDSPQWSRSAMFITYDEHGGLYDHVKPPKACEPDSRTPQTPGAKFDRYGVRVPFVVVSPFAKKKFVSHRVYDHTSITRFVEAKFTLPALSKRDANAEAPWDMFDFASPPNAKPSQPPAVVVDGKALEACKGWFTE
jgi:phospholipase C